MAEKNKKRDGIFRTVQNIFFRGLISPARDVCMEEYTLASYGQVLACSLKPAIWRQSGNLYFQMDFEVIQDKEWFRDRILINQIMLSLLLVCFAVSTVSKYMLNILCTLYTALTYSNREFVGVFQVSYPSPQRFLTWGSAVIVI